VLEDELPPGGKSAAIALVIRVCWSTVTHVIGQASDVITI
jgi:hypothetical protein